MTTASDCVDQIISRISEPDPGLVAFCPPALVDEVEALLECRHTPGSRPVRVVPAPGFHSVMMAEPHQTNANMDELADDIAARLAETRYGGGYTVYVTRTDAEPLKDDLAARAIPADCPYVVVGADDFMGDGVVMIPTDDPSGHDAKRRREFLRRHNRIAMVLSGRAAAMPGGVSFNPPPDWDAVNALREAAESR